VRLRLYPFLLFSLAVLCFPRDVRGQFVGYTSPQTVSQKVLNAQTTPTTVTINNSGQSIHAVTYTISTPCTNAMSFDLRIEASNDGVNWFSISEDATDQNNATIQGSTQGGLTAVGYYPAFRLNLAAFSCPSGQTPSITAFYSGTSTSTPSPSGVFYQSAPIRKTILLNQPTTNAATQPKVTVNVPTGMTGGSLTIACSNATTGAAVNCPAAMVVNPIAYVTFVGATGSTGSIISGSQSYTPDTTVTVSTFQFFNAPALSLTFGFSGAGTANVNWSVFYLSNPTPTPNYLPDPCATPANKKNVAEVNITTATTTTLTFTTTPGNLSIFVCGLVIDMVATGATTDTVQIEGGTGNNCTGPGPLTPVFSSGTLSAGATVISYGNGASTIFSQNGAQGGVSVCALTTVGTTPSIGVMITFVTQ
jgi:hypothetical protein